MDFSFLLFNLTSLFLQSESTGETPRSLTRGCELGNVLVFVLVFFTSFIGQPIDVDTCFFDYVSLVTISCHLFLDSEYMVCVIDNNKIMQPIPSTKRKRKPLRTETT